MRRRKNDGLPKYVSRRSYGVIYQPYLGRKDGKTLRGKPVNLGPVDMSVPEIWAAYNRETKQDNDTLRRLLVQNGIRFLHDAKGRIVTTVSAFEKRMFEDSQEVGF